MFSKFLDDQKRWSINFHLFEIFYFLLKSFSLIVSSIYFIREIINFRLWKLRVFTILQERLRHNARDKYRNLSEEENNKMGENMEEIETIMCLKRRSKNSKNIKEIIVKPAKVKRFFMDLIKHTMFFSHTLLNPQHLCHPYRLMEIRA